MSPDPDSTPPAFRVDWPPGPTADLGRAFLAYFPSRQGFRVTRAERVITESLADDPERNGTVVSEGLYRITISPLRVQYEILPINRVVRVLSVGFFPA
ncbi:MAG: type II toxin-antitoxin system RelE/ParE family toxin [Gemmataceae bacterium]